MPGTRGVLALISRSCVAVKTSCSMSAKIHVSAFGLRVVFECIVVTVAPWAPEILTWLWWDLPRSSLCAYIRVSLSSSFHG